MSEEYKARRLTDLATVWLAEQYPDSLIVEELSIGAWGSARLDLAAITPNEIIGIEIKGHGDKVDRLAMQTAIYSKAATRMLILPEPGLALKVPAHTYWPLLNVEGDKVRKVSRWPVPKLDTAPAQLLSACFGAELRTILAEAVSMKIAVPGLPKNPRVQQLRDALADYIPLAHLIPMVCRQIRSRDWESWNQTTKRKGLVRWAKDIVASPTAA